MRLLKIGFITALTLMATLVAPSCSDDSAPNNGGDTPGTDDPYVGPTDPNNLNLGTSKLVYTEPAIIVDSEEDIKIHFPVSGTNFDGYTEDIYAHIGLITGTSTSGSDWKYSPTWGDNSEKYKLAQSSPGVYTLTLPGGMRSYFGVTDPQEILSYIAIVFRSEDSEITQVDDGKDIYIKVNRAGALVLDIISPNSSSVMTIGESVDITLQINADAESIELYTNNVMTTTIETGENNPSYTFTPEAIGDYTIVVEATKGDESLRDSIVVVVIESTPIDVARPTDAKEGVTVSDDRTSATFVLYAPGKESVILLGDFNNYTPSIDYQMMRDINIATPDTRVQSAIEAIYRESGRDASKAKEAYFWITVDGLNPNTEYGYQFLVDGEVLVADPYCEKILDPWNDKYIPATVYPNLKSYPSQYTSQIISVFTTAQESPYNWSEFTRPPAASLSIYELLIRDFSTESSIDGVMEKLDYIESLGVNAVELMPVQEFSGNDSWGYAPMFYFAMDKFYGTKEDYKMLIDELHKRDIAVIIDVVFNHLTGDHPWMRMWMGDNWTADKNNPFFHQEGMHPDNVFNDIKHYTGGKMDRHIREVLQFLLTEYNVDGFRFDLTKGITESTQDLREGNSWYDYNPARIGILKGWTDAIREVDNSAYIIFEHWGSLQEEDELAAYNGIRLWKRADHPFAETAMGYVGSEKSNFGEDVWPARVNIIEDHDEERIAYKMITYSPLSYRDDWEAISNRLTGIYAFHFLSPGSKLMWQFGELGYDISIFENGRTGKKPVKWDYLEDVYRRQLYDNVSKILNFRKSNQHSIYANEVKDNQIANMNQDGNMWYVGDNDIAAKTLYYKVGNEAVIVIANFSQNGESSTREIDDLITGEWKNLITNGTYNIWESTHTFTVDNSDFLILVKDL